MKKLTLLVALILISFLLIIPASAATTITAKVIAENTPNMRMDCAESANILKNHNWNFEKGEYIWRFYGPYNYTFMVTDEDAHDGKYSLKLEGVGGWSCIKVPVKVKKNTDYTFSMWVKAKEGFDGKKNSCWKLFQVSSNDYSDIKQDEYFTGDKGFKYTNEWYQMAITVNSGDNQMLGLYIGDGGGVLYFDEIRVFETNNPDKSTTLEPANLQDLLARENPPTQSTTKATTVPKTEAPTESTTEAPSESTTEAPNELTTESDAETPKNDSTSTTNTDDTGGSGEVNNILPIVVAIAAAVLVAGGGIAFWALKLRKAK